MGAGKSCNVCRISIHALLAESDPRSGTFRNTPNISIHALLAESDNRIFWHRATNYISIHALLAESDRIVKGFCSSGIKISIHALLAESDDRACTSNPLKASFLSTLSLRRATIQFRNLDAHCQNFYPRSPCGERRLRSSKLASDFSFLSTLSLRRATAKVHKTVGHFCAYETNFMGIASSC